MKIIQKIYKNQIDAMHLNFYVKNTMKLIMKCRNGELGYHKMICEDCQDIAIMANSCRNRHCPICQKDKKEEWINHKKQHMINCRYYHIIATVPNVLYHVYFKM